MTESKSPGRPAFSEHGSKPTFVRLPVDVRTLAQAKADADGVSLSSYIRVVVARSVGSGYADPAKGRKK